VGLVRTLIIGFRPGTPVSVTGRLGGQAGRSLDEPGNLSLASNCKLKDDRGE
jgi:hypothetical protein